MKNQSVQRTTLSQQVATKLEHEILAKLKPGDKLETEPVLAKRFDVSVHTIREAISGFVHRGVLERRARRGTIVREGKAQSRHVAVWVASGVRQPMPNYWTARIMCRLPGLLNQLDIPAKLYWSWTAAHGQCHGFGYDEFLESLTRDSISVVVPISGWWGDEAERLIQQRQVPVAYFAGGLNPSHQFSVIHDDAAMIRKGVEHLLAQGCRRVAWLAWRDPRIKSRPSSYDTLYKMFCTVLRERGVEVRDSWICTDLEPCQAGAGYSEFREIWTAQSEKPDGLLVTDDVLFRDVVTAIAEFGIAVPARLKVVTTVNRGAAVPCPTFPAARIEVNPDALAEAMSELLVKVLKKQPIADPHVIVPFRWTDGYSLERSPARPEAFQVH